MIVTLPPAVNCTVIFFVSIVGGVASLVHVTVLAAVAVLPQPSLAVNVLVWDLSSVYTIRLLTVTVVSPQPSVAVAVPNEPSGLAGLQPRFKSV